MTYLNLNGYSLVLGTSGLMAKEPSEAPTMGFQEISDGEGYTTFGKGENVLARVANIDHDLDEYQGSEYYQLELVFDAVSETSDEQGRIPAWLSSKITIQDSEEHTSSLGKLLTAAGILDDVLKELGADADLIEKVRDGDERFEAENEDENVALMQAVAKHIGDAVIRTGTGHNSSGEYSVAKDFYESVDEDPFKESDDADEAADESGQQPLADQ